MTIRLLEHKKNRDKYWSQDYNESIAFVRNNNIEVICVITTWGSKYYLIVVREYGGYEYLDTVEAKDFYVTDNSIPKDWVELKWPSLSPFIKENSGIGISYRITYYMGPKCILQDNDFLFNLFEDRAMAYSFYQSNIGETNVK